MLNENFEENNSNIIDNIISKKLNNIFVSNPIIITDK